MCLRSLALGAADIPLSGVTCKARGMEAAVSASEFATQSRSQLMCQQPSNQPPKQPGNQLPRQAASQPATSSQQPITKPDNHQASQPSSNQQTTRPPANQLSCRSTCPLRGRVKISCYSVILRQWVYHEELIDEFTAMAHIRKQRTARRSFAR